MPTLNEICEQLTEDLSTSLECRLIDIANHKTFAQHPDSTADQNDSPDSDAVTNLLQGLTELGRGLAHAPSASRQRSARRELCITSAGCHLLASTIAQSSAVVVLKTPRSTSLGMAWAHLKAAIPSLDQHSPPPQTTPKQ